MIPDSIVVDPRRLAVAARPVHTAAGLVAAVVPPLDGAVRVAADAAAPLRSGSALTALWAALRPDLLLLAARLHDLARALAAAAWVYAAAEREAGRPGGRTAGAGSTRRGGGREPGRRMVAGRPGRARGSRGRVAGRIRRAGRGCPYHLDRGRRRLAGPWRDRR
ncbi:MAG TPA: hypothetical protein VKP11_03485 [Frankiaceae bacterium]|nr:hypothetical protein [Frankiaceae bacterium]